MFGSADGMRGATDFFSLRRVVFIWGCIRPQLEPPEPLGAVEEVDLGALGEDLIGFRCICCGYIASYRFSSIFLVCLRFSMIFNRFSFAL